METKDNGDLWEAVATRKFDTLKQKWKEDASLLYKCKLGGFGQSILHVVASHGRVSDVQDILSHDPELAQVLDSRSWSPLHVAAAKGHKDVLQQLIPHSYQMARVKTDQGDTILHLCVKQNDLDALKLLITSIKDSEFANRKDAEGNTILHLAVILGHKQMAEYLLKNKIVGIYSNNENGNTVLDIAYKNKRVGGMKDIEKLLHKFGALRTKDLNSGKWLTKKRDSLMIVATLMATMAFQACITPPGGVWQNNGKDDNLVNNGKDYNYTAGESVMAYYYPDQYPFFLRVNTIGFMGSLSTILLLITGLPFKKKIIMWMLVLIMWVTISAMAITFGFSMIVVTPGDNIDKLGDTLVIGAFVWGGLMILLLIWHSLVLLTNWFLHKNIHPCPNFCSNFCRFCSGPTPENQSMNEP